ncbi:MAG: single-stranded-DNA-specific exonuclease RecJ [Opitutales bacterium]
MEWRSTQVPASVARRLQEGLGIGRVSAELLAQRGFENLEEARLFLHPRLADLGDPYALGNVKPAAERLIRALRSGESISILGDYDVDGVTSTALLVDALRAFGANPHFFVPLRLVEGYGLTEATIERVLQEGNPSLFIALDCGTNSVSEVAALRARGIDVIIVDHHRSKDAIPSDCLLVNPHVDGGPDVPWRQLCTVGLVFKLVHGLVKRLREEGDPVAEGFKLKEYLDFVAMGTVADLVPLLRENRILCRHGLRRLANSSRRGINALFEVSGLQLGQDIQPPDISFRLGPRINASGRLDDAVEPVKLFLNDDYHACLEAARKLDAFNRERELIEREMVQQACQWVEELDEGRETIVVAGCDWHPGVVGIVAGKLARDYGRPCIALGRDGDSFVGSGRSSCGINLQKILQRCDRFLGEWGGHPMAVGVTLDATHLSAFREAFENEVAAERARIRAEAPALEVNVWVQPRELTDSLLAELDALRPFGEGNPEPIIGVSGMLLRNPPSAFGRGNLRFRVSRGGGPPLSVVGWRMGENPPPVGQRLDFAGKFNRHTFNGTAIPQLELVAWRRSQP